MAGKLVTLTVYYSIIEAKICISMLQAHGIYAFAPTELANNSSHLMTALGGIPVMVVEIDYEAAKALLADIEAEAESLEPPEPKSWWQTVLHAAVGTASTLLFGIPPPPTPPKASRQTVRRDLRSDATD